MAVNWGLGQTVDVGGALMAGFQRGQQQREQMDRRAALADYAMNPNDGALAKVARYEPQFAMQIQEDRRKQEAAARKAEVMQRAYAGDKGAMAEMFGFDPDLVLKMDEGTKKQVAQSIDFVANAALEIDRLPEEQRSAVWESYVRQAEARGMDIPTEYEKYSPDVLRSAIAEGDLMKELLGGRDPKYQVVPEGGILVNTRDPQALEQVNNAPQIAPKEAIEALKAGQGTPAQFDAIFGPGAAQKALGGQAAPPPATFPGWY